MYFRRITMATALILASSAGVAGGQEVPPARSNFFIEMALGQQGVHAYSVSTPVDGQNLQPFDRNDIMERVALGYSLRSYLNFEAGLTFFSGYGYQVSSSKSNFNRSLIAFELFVQPMLNYDRVHFYAMGGPALVYSGVGSFKVRQPGDDGFSELTANWPNTYYIRPEAGVGIAVDATSQIRLGAVFARLFGTGHFASQVVGDQLQVSRGYVPTVDYLAANLMFVF